MGCQPILPGEFLTTREPPLEDFLDKLKTDALHPPRPILHKNTELPTALPPDLAAADFVEKHGRIPHLQSHHYIQRRITGNRL